MTGLCSGSPAGPSSSLRDLLFELLSCYSSYSLFAPLPALTLAWPGPRPSTIWSSIGPWIAGRPAGRPLSSAWVAVGPTWGAWEGALLLRSLVLLGPLQTLLVTPSLLLSSLSTQPVLAETPGPTDTVSHVSNSFICHVVTSWTVGDVEELDEGD